MALGHNPLCKPKLSLSNLEKNPLQSMIFDRFQLHHFESAGEDQYSDEAATTCSTGLMFYMLDSYAETGGEAAHMCACDLLLKKASSMYIYKNEYVYNSI
jgi:hypothetical protein